MSRTLFVGAALLATSASGLVLSTKPWAAQRHPTPRMLFSAPETDDEAAAQRSRGYTRADQVARFAAAKAEDNKRYLEIESVFDGTYLKDKRVLVTGGNKGLGLAIVKELTEQGAQEPVSERSFISDAEFLHCFPTSSPP